MRTTPGISRRRCAAALPPGHAERRRAIRESTTRERIAAALAHLQPPKRQTPVEQYVTIDGDHACVRLEIELHHARRATRRLAAVSASCGASRRWASVCCGSGSASRCAKSRLIETRQRCRWRDAVDDETVHRGDSVQGAVRRCRMLPVSVGRMTMGRATPRDRGGAWPIRWHQTGAAARTTRRSNGPRVRIARASNWTSSLVDTLRPLAARRSSATMRRCPAGAPARGRPLPGRDRRRAGRGPRPAARREPVARPLPAGAGRLHGHSLAEGRLQQGLRLLHRGDPRSHGQGGRTPSTASRRSRTPSATSRRS